MSDHPDVEVVEADPDELRAVRAAIYGQNPVLRDYYADRAADAADGGCTCCTKYAEKYVGLSGLCDHLEAIAWMLGEDIK